MVRSFALEADYRRSPGDCVSHEGIALRITPHLVGFHTVLRGADHDEADTYNVSLEMKSQQSHTVVIQVSVFPCQPEHCVARSCHFP